MKYGHFSKDGREFIITNVATPSPWINYLYNDKYFSTISNNGGGVSYIRNPLHGRITRYRINDLPHDRPGKYIYLKDLDTGELWSLTWQPVGRFLEAYQVVHGFGYTKVTAQVLGIHSSVLYFVPLNDNQEIWSVQLTNRSDKNRKLSVYGYVEFCLGHALIDLINQCDDQHFNRVYFDQDINTLFATKTYWVTENAGTQQQENKSWDQWAFFTTNLHVEKYETLRERFIGAYRNENKPLGIEKDSLSSQDTDYGNAVGVLQSIVELEPGEKKEFIFSLGVIPKNGFKSKNKYIPVKYHNSGLVSKAFKDVKQSWVDYFQKAYVKTPEPDINVFMNYWTPYQAKVAFDVGRVASFYYWGIGRGFGFRDTAQDVIAVVISRPEKARERIHLLARQIFSDGHVYHHFYNEGQGEVTRHCDDPLWFILAVTEYLKETGDFDLLDEVEPFADQKTGTIYHHLLAITNFVKNNHGKHGLPVFGRGDWNDTLDYIGGDEGGESVWGAMFYTAMLKSLFKLLVFLDKSQDAEGVKKLYIGIQESVNKYCWDGEWFIRAFGAKDRIIGSKNNRYGKIFINTQSWAVISEISDQEKLLKAMDSAYSHLDTEYGPKICAPAFKEIDENIGLITRCVPGKKENGAVFCHPTTWLIQAECMLGRGDRAYYYYKKMLPNNIDSDRFIAEPYVYSQYITSDEHKTEGRASHSWQTGTAAWMYYVCLNYMLGVRAVYDGLIIDPVIPSHWETFVFKRLYRGTEYDIQIFNPDKVQKGVKEIIMEEEKIRGNIITFSDRKTCKVKVIMGKSN